MARSSRKSLLLVNPWVHDFSAYDLWMKPLGLLYLAGILRSVGYGVSLLDCLQFSSAPADWAAGRKAPRRKRYGQGHLYKEGIPRPGPLQGIPRQYRRYGLPPGVVEKWLDTFPRPEAILVTSLMTYWYPGLFETIALLRGHFPGVPILLGGIYATLCPEHAREYAGADHVLPGPWGPEKMKLLADLLGNPAPSSVPDFALWPYPAFDLYPRLEYVCLLTRAGCPFSCTYCAAPRLMPGLKARPPGRVVSEVLHWRNRGVTDMAFYDDALLVTPREHIVPILEGVIREGARCRFHTPNALHVRAIDEKIAGLLFRSGFRTIRLGLETTHEDLQNETGGKVTNREFREAVGHLKSAGYGGEDLGVYLMAGLPGQRVEEVEESIAHVREAGAKPILVEYSPIPGTPLFEKAAKGAARDFTREPLFQNNSLFPCQWEGFTFQDYQRIKRELQEIDRGRK